MLLKLIYSGWWLLISSLEFLYLRVIGVSITYGSEFRGWCHVFKYAKSYIRIGEKCVFNYSSFSNHIGLNHRCILSTMKRGASITIGNNVGISSSTITAFTSVEIGNNVRIGANCVIMDGDFHLDDPRTTLPKPIKIGDNVWLGYGVVVLKGVTIGNNTLIGINSVVTRDIPANCIAGGNPCKVIKTI